MSAQIDSKKTVFNTAMLYLMTAAKLIFPLVTLPYLCRVLTVDSYGVVTYVKSCMTYFQLFIDFGFILSAVKDIVDANEDNDKIGYITGQVIVARLCLSAASFVVLIIISLAIPLLRVNFLYTLLSFIVVAMSSFLLDFLYRGIEKMHLIATVFVSMKSISTLFTFVVVKDDSDLLLIPILDIISTLVAIVINIIQLNKLQIKIRFENFKTSFDMIKNSWTYFISNMATTAFSVLNTVLIGIFITPKEVAFWGVSLQLISAVQNFYTPINNGIYPQMIKAKSFAPIKKILMIFMPIVIAGCVFVFVLSEPIITIISGEQYAGAVPVFRALIPVLFFSFPGMLLGWPTLGAIGKVAETTRTTVITAIVQCAGLGLLIVFDAFTLMNVAIFRCITEALLMILRASYCFKFRSEFQ